MRAHLMQIALAVGGALALAACQEQAGPAERGAGDGEGGAPVIYTTFYPTTYFAERIAGDEYEVVCPLPEDADPIFWKPGRDDLAAYQQADALIINGAEFEKWVPMAALPASRVIDSAATIPGGYVTFESTTHSHGAGGEHTHEGIDGHTWLAPEIAIAQAAAIRDGLGRLFPEDAEQFARGFDGLRQDLEDLDARFGEVTAALEGAQLLASHPAYNYLAREYGWDVHNFDLDPESPIGADAWDDVADHIDAAAQMRIMLWESEPLQETRERLSSELGVTSVLFSPAELVEAQRLETGEDYFSIMRANLDRLEAAVSGS
ncbi:MAG: metal ABC transporter substrate-binding protein [Phycisphaerales bacterium JB039]